MAPAVLTVNTLADVSDHTHLDLREALTAVDTGSTAGLTAAQKHHISGTLGQNDQIKFATGMSGTITLTQGRLDITRAVRITGPGASKLSIDAQQQSQVFDISTAGIPVTLSSLTVTNGQASEGAGIFNLGNLTISNCTIEGNRVNNGAGGAGNFNGGTLTVTGSTIADNIALGGLGGDGGGIFNGSSSTLTMAETTLYHNNAHFGGGLDNLGTATLTSVTVTANLVHPDLTAGYCAGLLVGTGGTLLLHNCIVAGNVNLGGGLPSDIATVGTGTVDASSSYNLIGTGGSGGLVNGVNHNLVGVANPGLGTLANNGGPTPTVALLPGSPAIDNGDPALRHVKDQRGVRPRHHVSIGAFQAD
jgi:hypothetical protein